MKKRTYEIKDANTGEITRVTFEVINRGVGTGRASMIEALEEDLYEAWGDDDLVKAGVTIEEWPR
jgi:hypothetical protein